MIRLTSIKTTDAIKQLRGQINAMQNEIVADQPFVGTLVNPSINYYDIHEGSATLVATNAASAVKSSLTALCFPESNGMFVACVWGMVQITEDPQDVGSGGNPTVIAISVPAIKLATMPVNVSTFVSCEHLGLPSIGEMPGITTKPVQANIADITVFWPSGSFDVVTPSIEQGGNVCNIIFSRSF